MRTTITIPDDVLLAAKQRAQARGQTVGEALADLARRGIEAEDAPGEFWKGVKLFPKRPDEPPVTLEKVNRLRDESL
jgi:transposase